MPPSRPRQEIAAEPDPLRRRALAAALLGPAASRGDLSTGLEALVATVDGEPTAAERGALRVAFRRANDPGIDRSGVLRTHAVRLLGRVPGAADRDLFVEATRTFCRDTGVDTSAELRGLGLRALAEVDPATARWIAAERIEDPEPPNQEPHRTALAVLAAHGDHLLIRAWLDRRPIPVPIEVAAAAEAELVAVMPASEWALRAPSRLGDERPLETITAAEAVVAVPRTDLARALAALLAGITGEDLFRAVAMTLAAARDAAFSEALIEVVERVPIALLDAYTEALAICRSTDRDRALDRVSARARAGHGRPPVGEQRTY